MPAPSQFYDVGRQQSSAIMAGVIWQENDEMFSIFYLKIQHYITIYLRFIIIRCQNPVPCGWSQRTSGGWCRAITIRCRAERSESSASDRLTVTPYVLARTNLGRLLTIVKASSPSTATSACDPEMRRTITRICLPYRTLSEGGTILER